MNTDRLLKLLRMTTSPHDGEALNAMRMANAMVKEAGMDWGDLLHTGSRSSGSGSHQTRSSARTTSSRRDLRIREMLDTLLQCVPQDNGFYDFVISVGRYYVENGDISNAQYDAIERAYNKRKRKRA